MRLLDSAGAAYQVHSYDAGDGAIDGISAARKIGKDSAVVYKTLVTKGAKTYFVFVIPVAAELDLKKAAKAVGEKAVSMIPVADIQKVTGYIRGGCSPLGMKKQYQTVFDETALQHEAVIVSAGRIGAQVETAPQVLIELSKGAVADLTHR